MTQYTPLTPEQLQRERSMAAFRAQLARVTCDARNTRTPMCPVRPLETVTHAGLVYAVEQIEIAGFNTMSGKARWIVVLTPLETGVAVESMPVLWTQRRSKKTGELVQRYNHAGRTYPSWADLVTALAAHAAASVPAGKRAA